MDNSLLAVRDINHKYIVVEKGVIPYPSETRLGDGEKRYSPGKLKIVAISLN